MRQFGWFSEREGRVTFLICFRKTGYPERDGGGGFPQKRGVPTLEETTGSTKKFTWIIIEINTQINQKSDLPKIVFFVK